MGICLPFELPGSCLILELRELGVGCFLTRASSVNLADLGGLTWELPDIGVAGAWSWECPNFSLGDPSGNLLNLELTDLGVAGHCLWYLCQPLEFAQHGISQLRCRGSGLPWWAVCAPVSQVSSARSSSFAAYRHCKPYSRCFCDVLFCFVFSHVEIM